MRHSSCTADSVYRQWLSWPTFPPKPPSASLKHVMTHSATSLGFMASMSSSSAMADTPQYTPLSRRCSVTQYSNESVLEDRDSTYARCLSPDGVAKAGGGGRGRGQGARTRRGAGEDVRTKAGEASGSAPAPAPAPPPAGGPVAGAATAAGVLSASLDISLAHTLSRSLTREAENNARNTPLSEAARMVQCVLLCGPLAVSGGIRLELVRGLGQRGPTVL